LHGDQQMLIKLKFRFTEIFFGMLLATAIFAMGAVFLSSGNHPSESKTGANSENKNQSNGEGSGLWNWLTRDATGLFTGVLVLVGAIQIGVFLGQLRLIRRTLGPAEEAAKAARDAANVANDALTKLESPFVGIEILESGFKSKLVSAGEYYVTLEESLHFQFINHGRSPATIIEMFDKFEICATDKLPPPLDPHGLRNQVPFGVILSADGGRSPPSTRNQSEDIDPQEFMRVTVGDDALAFIGYVRFRDIFNRDYITGFCLRLARYDGRFYFAGDHRYNYAYKEKRDEDY
jgi:hypothetical protein